MLEEVIYAKLAIKLGFKSFDRDDISICYINPLEENTDVIS